MRFSPRIPSRRPLLAAVVAVAAVGGTTTALAVGPLGEDDRSGALAAAIDPSTPRNVILLIGDGTDDSIITAARNYEHGAAGRFPALDGLPFTGDMTTHGLQVGPGPDYPIAYVSDSAPTASGWSTGKKTVDSRLSQGPSSADTVPGEDYPTAMEILRDQGKRTGNVSTAELTDATPAAAAAHINLRECKGPANMAKCSTARKANGGKGSVAEQLVDNRIDVLLGGARSSFNQKIDADDRSVAEYARDEHDYITVQDRDGLEAIESLQNGPILGLFANGNMTPKYDPLVATAPPGAGGPNERCTEADRGDQPSLEAMTRKAIVLLDNPKGFFLQVESAMVDKQEHASDICGAIGDVGELDRAVQAALDYQSAHPDTLIIVTSDHAHSTQIVPGTSGGKQVATLKTADGDPMYVGYSTQASGSSHTGTQVRVAAQGPQAANVTGLIDQTDLFQTILGRTPSTMPDTTKTITVPGATVTTPGAPVTVPGPTKTVRVPAQPGRPRVATATAPTVTRTALRRTGLRVPVAASDARRVTVELRRGSKRLARRTTKATGGTVTLKATTTRGTVRVVATAVGTGGKRTTVRSVRVR